jgi:dienelactone hydrolase
MGNRWWTLGRIVAPCFVIGACAAGSSNESLTGGHESSSGSSGASSGGNSSGSGGSSGYASSSGSSGSQSSSGISSSGGGDDGGDDGGGTSSNGGGDDGGAGASSGSTSSGGGSSGTSSSSSGSGGSSSGSCTPIQRGAAPTSDSAATTGPYSTMVYAADASVRMTDAYDVTSAHIYYPVGATPPYAALSIVPGFVSPESSIADWGPFLASWGFVVMTIGTSDPTTGASDTSVLPDVREAALLDALTTIKDENTRSGSPLNGQLDLTRLGVAGWSMGGGGTLMAANSTPWLKAVFAMEPWNPNVTYPMDTVPTLMFAGTSDGLAGPPMPQDQYQSIPSTTPKMLYEVTNGSHYVSTSPTNSTTDMAPDSVSTPSVARFGLSWLKVFMECDDRFRPFLLVKPSDAAEFDTTLM